MRLPGRKEETSLKKITFWGDMIEPPVLKAAKQKDGF